MSDRISMIANNLNLTGLDRRSISGTFDDRVRAVSVGKIVDK
ncbi:hypothetical protein [Nostoc linckia]|jgi:hypothetical protein|nr:hypothetical protein [Nostoc linckia]